LTTDIAAPRLNSPRQVLFASLAGTTIEFFDFYGPLGTMLSELFPTTIRYTGSSLTFNLAGIFGAGQQLRLAVRRLLSVRGRMPVAGRPPGSPRNQRR